MQTYQCYSTSDGTTTYFSCLLRAIGLEVDFYCVYFGIFTFILPVRLQDQDIDGIHTAFEGQESHQKILQKDLKPLL